jgi:uncharacterized protein
MIVTYDGFEWDDAKNLENIRNHGIGFANAVSIFDGFVLTRIDERFDYDELREVSFGLYRGIVVLAVVHTDRGERMRIVSARQATPTEAKRYETALRKGTYR